MRRLLILDKAGAALTAAITLGAFSTGLVEGGVPRHVWWVLGSLAFAMAVAGGLALRRGAATLSALRRFAVSNLLYAAASVGVVFAWRDTVTMLAASYVLVEAIVLVALAAAEWTRRIDVKASDIPVVLD